MRTKPMTTTKAAAVIDRVENDLLTAKRKLAELDNARGRIALDGGDIAAHGAEVAAAAEMVTTLTAGLAAARDQHAAASAREDARALEAEAEAIREEHTPLLELSLVQLGAALIEVCAAAESIAAETAKMEQHNERARTRGRDDLVLQPASVRARVVAEIVAELGSASSDIPVPDRLGESDEAFVARVIGALEQRAKSKENDVGARANVAFARRVFVARNPGEAESVYVRRLVASIAQGLNVSPFLDMAGTTARSFEESEDDFNRRVLAAAAKKLDVHRVGESDDAYLLRRARTMAKRADRRSSADPIREYGWRALALIQEHALGLDASQRNRTFPKHVRSTTVEGRTIDDPKSLLLYAKRHYRPLS